MMKNKKTNSPSDNVQSEESIKKGQKKFVLDCRRTGMGAETRILFPTPKKFDFSKTGNHWKECVLVSEGDEIFVRDITNSRKHRCFALKLEKGEFFRILYEVANSECPNCPICYKKEKGEKKNE